ncbi:MAG: AMP-binding protein, partial [Sphingomonadales bacterium]
DGLHTDFPEQRPRFLTLDRAGDAENGCVQPIPTVQTSADDLAYILYTSGSTGRPKGVMLSHRNAVSFVDWCTEALEPDGSDRFSSHAPFHFDLSILDIYLPIKHGATLYLIGEELSKNPAGMVEMIARNHLTFWYSTPSVLRILMDFGKLADQPDCSLRKIAFAGEVFPVKHLRALQKILPEVRYFNLYGPTETNVCTAFEVVGPIPDERIDPYPIGPVCSHLRARVIDGEGRDVAVGEEGELIISGPGVMQGYWNMADRTAAAFIEDETGRWYRTGDIVIEGDGGVFGYVGRRDRMVKRRGFRIELGEIEAALYRHPEVSEVASIAQSGPDGVVIKAFYSTRNGDTLSLIQLKQFCSRTLPLYMIPDCFSHQQGLPKTSTDKIDYQRLQDFE